MKKIVWSISADRNLRKVYRFYKKTATKKVADKILIEIFTAVKSINSGEKIFQEEESLKKLKQHHRYIVSRHCKIIFFIEEDKIIISHVFDTRQNPKKLK
jgi:plasmid stabilization system protein ParE